VTGIDEAFDAFFADAEPRLRRALVAAYGPERGREAAAEALAHAWARWEEVRVMANPVGYLYRVGQSRSRPRREPRVPAERPAVTAAWVEPELPAALAALSERERLAVVLVEGFGWTHREVAELAGVGLSSVQSYLARGLRELRQSLGVSEDA
jgi:DNA-directed RNA polymerase specialized sigma24 family protein